MTVRNEGSVSSEKLGSLCAEFTKELQNTELLLIKTIFTINQKRGKIKSDEKADEMYANRFKDTFGQLLQILIDLKAESDLQLSTKYFEEINKIKKLRDHFAHDFFKQIPSFDSQELMEQIIRGNQFAFETIKKSNHLLQNSLKDILRTMNYTLVEIEEMVEINSENWNEIIYNGG